MARYRRLGVASLYNFHYGKPIQPISAPPKQRQWLRPIQVYTLCILNAYKQDTFLQVQFCHNYAIPSIKSFNIIIEGYIRKSNVAAATEIVIMGPIELFNSKTHNVWFIPLRFNKRVFFLVRYGTKIKLFELL